MKRLLLLAIFTVSTLAFSATTSQVNTYTNGAVLTADQLNSEFSNIYATLNNLDQDNLSSSSAIEPTKISSTIDGDGISRQSDGSLDVNVDGSTVKIVSDVVKIVDLPGSALATGAVGSTQIANGGVAKVDLAVKTTGTTAAVGNVGLSASSGASVITLTSASTGDLANNLVNLTTNGGPVRVQMIPGTAATDSYIECEDATTDTCTLELARNGATVTTITVYGEGGKFRIPPGSFSWLDTPAAGTYAYKIKYNVGSATALRVLNVRLMAYEL